MKIREGFYTSYKTHNYCRNCDDGHKSGWILKKDCPGKYCPYCSRRIRTKPRFNKTEWTGGRY